MNCLCLSRQLCLLLNAEDIYRCCSEILLREEDMKFASHMIQTLSTILLTSTELFELRTQLKDLKTEVNCSVLLGRTGCCDIMIKFQNGMAVRMLSRG